MGEGVYGLRRAFQLAGAETVISSLWKVPDKETSEIITALYGDSNETLPEKLRRIQLKQIAKLRKYGYADHPFVWGAWVVTGDWK